LPDDHCLDPYKYNPDDFDIQLRIFFAKHPCFLCNKIHPVVVHMARIRFFFLKHRVFRIDVFRILCKPSKRIRIKTGNRRQYTLTVLPAFLIPYARVTFRALSEAIPLHLQGCDPDLVLNNLSADDPRTFALHFGRVTMLAPRWNLAITGWLIATGMTAEPHGSVDIFVRSRKDNHPWETFVGLASAFCGRLASIGRIGVILGSEQPLPVHARLTYAGMGLGP
jgi:hypothetical protein